MWGTFHYVYANLGNTHNYIVKYITYGTKNLTGKNTKLKTFPYIIMHKNTAVFAQYETSKETMDIHNT